MKGQFENPFRMIAGQPKGQLKTLLSRPFLTSKEMRIRAQRSASIFVLE